MTASGGVAGSVPVVRVVRSPDGWVTGELLVVIARPVSDTGAYAREQRARYAREYACTRWVQDEGEPRQQLCRVPFARGEPAWPAVLATLDSLVRHQPPPEIEPDTGPKSPALTVTPPNASMGRSEASFVERLPVDRITQCLDASRWEIIEWVGRQERRVTPPLALPGCAPRTEAGKAYARAGSELLMAVINAARLSK